MISFHVAHSTNPLILLRVYGSLCKCAIILDFRLTNHKNLWVNYHRQKTREARIFKDFVKCWGMNTFVLLYLKKLSFLFKNLCSKEWNHILETLKYYETHAKSCSWVMLCDTNILINVCVHDWIMCAMSIVNIKTTHHRHDVESDFIWKPLIEAYCFVREKRDATNI